MRAHALIFLGAPGAGKGTQSREISKRFCIPQISTGDILRDAVRRETAVGKAAEASLDAGELVSDDIVCTIVEERISQPDCLNGFILDGFPRTIPQAEFFDRLLETKGLGRLIVFNVQVSEELLTKRITGRRICSTCGEIYNIYFNPPKVDGTCCKDGGVLEHRADDYEEAIRQRLDDYQKLTSPLIAYYSEQGNLVVIDGTKDPEVITKELTDYLLKA
jgi:adenylate kinase